MKYRGIVQRGERRGAALGFPTANITLGDETSGIFAARTVVDGNSYLAAVYADTGRNLLEVHLLDFSGDLYDKEIEVELVKKVREDRKFEDVKSLQERIRDDIEAVRSHFAEAEV
jgi:riboflavin kinase / FMN adenylyltransferase